MFAPRPFSTFAIEGSPITSRHSVLHILKKDDTSIIFDGTVEKFGWEASKAISSLEDFCAQCTLDGDGKTEAVEHGYVIITSSLRTVATGVRLYLAC